MSSIIENKQHMLGIRIDAQDREKLVEIAKDEDRSIASILRKLIKRKIYHWERKKNAA